MKRTIAVLLCLVAATSTAEAQGRWSLLRDLVGVDILFDTSTVRAEEERTTAVWEKWKFSPVRMFQVDHTGPKLPVAYTISLIVYDCAARRYGTKKILWYDKAGTVLWESGSENTSLIEPIPDSLGEGALSSFCNYLKTGKAP